MNAAPINNRITIRNFARLRLSWSAPNADLVLIAAAAGFIKLVTATVEKPRRESVASLVSTTLKIKIETSSGGIVDVVCFRGTRIKNKKSVTPENKMNELKVCLAALQSIQRMPRAPPI